MYSRSSSFLSSSLLLLPPSLLPHRYIAEAERIVSDVNEQRQWMMKGGVKRAAAELGMKMNEIQTKSLKHFAREPGRPNLVARHIKELRYNHYNVRRIEKIATILKHLVCREKYILFLCF